jgi:hypothetical protein
MDGSLTSRNVQHASTLAAGQVRRFAAWLADDAGPALARLICGWLREPRGSAGDAPACAWDVAVLRAGILATWPPGAARAPEPSCEPGPGKAWPASSYARRRPAALAWPGGGRQCR